MTITTQLRNTFSAGEIAPLLHRRTDFVRNQTGMAKCRGFLPLREGGFTRAPGTEFLGYAKDDQAGRLVGFEFAANDALVLEFTPLAMRVWRYGDPVLDGAAPYELDTSFAADALPLLQWVQSADVIYMADGGSHQVQRLARYALDNWTIGDVPWTNGPFQVQNLEKALTIAPSDTEGTVTLTASAAVFEAGHIGTLMMIEPTDQTSVPLWTSNTGVEVGDLMRNDGNTYQLVNYDGGDVFGTSADTKESPPIHTEGTERVSNSPVIDWKFIDDGRGIVQITAVTSSTEATATVLRNIPKPCVEEPSYRWSQGAWGPLWGYPSSLAMIDQRLAAAASETEPRTLWFSTVGDFEDHEPSTEADGAFAYAISARSSLNPIQSLVAGGKALHVFGLSEEQSTRSSAAQQAIGPTTAMISFDSEIGASPALPIAPDGAPIFISRDKRRLYQIVYSFEADRQRPLELSVTARHIGDLAFEELAWIGSPHGLLAVRLGTGDIAILTYDREQDVLGWCVWPLAGGYAESMAVTPSADGSRDELTLIVRRTLGGQTRRCIERLSPLFAALPDSTPPAEAQHAFCALVFTPEAAADSFSVPHLAGETVYAWTDLGGFGPLIVADDGMVTLPRIVGRASIGLLDSTQVAETLDLQAAAPEGSAMGRRKRLHANSTIALHRTAQGRIYGIERTLGQAPRTSDPALLVPLPFGADYSEAYSGFVRVPVPSGNAEEIALGFTPEGLAPMTVTAVVPVIEEEGR